MNKDEVYAIIPNPSDVEAPSYELIHNYLVDALNELPEGTTLSASGVALSVLSEVSDWTHRLLNTIGKAHHE